MDGIADILVLLVMVVATVVGALSKTKKQVAQTPHPHSEERKSIFTPNYNAPQYVDEEGVSLEMIDATERKSIGKTISKLKVNPLRAPASEDHLESVGKLEERFVLDDFDLRTAVIYSEILRPKFDE